jgi:threonine/homoserine/homoserine lactone efflux protein
MRAIDGAGAFGVLGIGFVLAAFNPKDMLLAAAGGTEIGSADLSGTTTFVALMIFTAIAASTAIVPVGAYLIVGERLDERLHRSRRWLIRHNPAVMATVLVAVGALFIAEGTQILWG